MKGGMAVWLDSSISIMKGGMAVWLDSSISIMSGDMAVWSDSSISIMTGDMAVWSDSSISIMKGGMAVWLDSFVDMIHLLLNIIHFQRTGNWNGYLETFYNFLPYCFALSRHNYVHNLSYY